MKHTVKAMPSIPKEADGYFIWFKNNDGPRNQVHLQGIAEAGEECSSSGHCIDHQLCSQQILFFVLCLETLAGDLIHALVFVKF